MEINIPNVTNSRVVIIGCGFGGLTLARELKGKPFQVVMIDKHNYHTFQPLLYQVSTAGLEADSIAYPIRKIFKGQENFYFRMAEATHVDTTTKKVITSIGEVSYDFLVIATGSTTNYFGIPGIETQSMPMKSVVEALNLRSLILQNFEKAIVTKDLVEQSALMTFVVVGGGPTGVELAGALCELKKHVLPHDYPELDIRKMRVILVESGNEILQNMNIDNQQRAFRDLQELGCEMWLNTRVTKYEEFKVVNSSGKELISKNVIWTAGVKGCPIEGLSENSIDKRGRIQVDEFNKIKNCDSEFALGDVACLATDFNPTGLPMIAPVAIQQAENLARNLELIQKNKPLHSFLYKDKGSMATIGRNRAVAQKGSMNFQGFTGWLAWMLLHLILLIGFRNKMIVFINWVWNYLNYDRNIRLIVRPFSFEEKK